MDAPLPMPTGLQDALARRKLIEKLADRLAGQRTVPAVWLLCARARGDNLERSDTDLAIETPFMDDRGSLEIKLDFADEASTLVVARPGPNPLEDRNLMSHTYREPWRSRSTRGFAPVHDALREAVLGATSWGGRR